MSTTINPAPRRRRIGLVLGAAGVTALLAATLPELTAAGEAVVAAAASPATVQIDNFAFTPATLTVTAGTTVTWKNDDDSLHRIGHNKGTFKSAALDTTRPSPTSSHRWASTRMSVRSIRRWSERSSSKAGRGIARRRQLYSGAQRSSSTARHEATVILFIWSGFPGASL